MAIEDAAFFEQDEPEFDLGFSIAPGDQVADQLESVVETVNDLQNKIDGFARSKIASAQTGQNMLSNKIRMSAQEVMESPTETIADFQNTMAVDAAGRMADVSERVNSIISAISKDDFFSSRCIQRCWSAYRDCAANKLRDDPVLLHCANLLEDCILRCRSTLPDKEIIPPGMPPRPGGFPEIEVLQVPPKPEPWIEPIVPTGFPTEPPPPQPAPVPDVIPIDQGGIPVPVPPPAPPVGCPLPVPVGFPGWGGVDGWYNSAGGWVGQYNSDQPPGTQVFDRCGVPLGTVGGAPDCVVPTDPAVEMSDTGMTQDPRVCGWQDLSGYATYEYKGSTFYIIPGTAADHTGPNPPGMPESKGSNGFAGAGSLSYAFPMRFVDFRGRPLPAPPNMINVMWPVPAAPGNVTIPGYGEMYSPLSLIPVCEYTGCPDEIPAPDVPAVSDQPFCIPICQPACPSEDVPPVGTCELWLDCEKREVYIREIDSDGITIGDPRNLRDILLGTGSVSVDDIDCPDDDEEEPPEEPEDTLGGDIPDKVSLDKCKFLPPGYVFAPSSSITNRFCEIIGLTDSEGNTKDFFELDSPVSTGIVQGVVTIFSELCQSVEHVLRMFSGTPGDCDTATMHSLETTRAFYNIISLITGPTFENAEIRSKQQYDFCAPARIPTVEVAVEAFLGDGITRGEAECWVRGNNYIWENYEKVLKARRSKLGVHELIQLMLRGEIGQAEYSQRVRELGFTDQSAPDEFHELSKWVPGPQDLIRWMVRDVEDTNIVNTFNLDANFKDPVNPANSKFGGKVEEYADWQNIDEEDMLRMWRAHWDIPGPSQLYQMLHRNRPGRVPANIETDLAAVQLALEQQDIAPYWVERLINVAYHPLSRVDIRRAFRIGAVDRQEVIEGYKDLGYNDQNSVILADFAEQLVLNGWLRHRFVGMFASGEIVESEFNTLLGQEGAAPEYINEATNRAKLLRKADTRKKCLKAARQDYFHGSYTEAEAITRVTNLGLAGGDAVDIVEGWTCELQSRSKSVPASTLCQWWQEGIIAGDTFHKRLINLGYSQADADHLVLNCETKYERKLEAAEKSRIRKSAADRKKREKTDQGEKTTEDKEAARLERMREKARKVRQRREDMLVESAKRLTNRLKIDIVQTLREVRTAYRNMKNAQMWHEADIVVAIVQASQLKTVESLMDYTQAVVSILNELPAEEVGEHGHAPTDVPGDRQ